jgi:RNA polymerase sigma-70 factor (ECF subfamily)
VRIRDARDGAAWSQFVTLYAPLVYGHAQKHGMQDADAADLTQDVLRAVAGAIHSIDQPTSRACEGTHCFTMHGCHLRHGL